MRVMPIRLKVSGFIIKHCTQCVAEMGYDFLEETLMIGINMNWFTAQEHCPWHMAHGFMCR